MNPLRRGHILLLLSVSCGQGSEAPPSDERPNFLVLVADDLGYGDLGLLGSEIRTPNIDSLATEGLVLTNFHVGTTCSPTRAMLLSGTDAHIAGLGTMAGDQDDNQKGQPGYEAFLSDRVVTIASLLRDGGYHTYIAGKWHLGGAPEQLPENRGFEKSFTLLSGGAGHFGDGAPLFRGGSTRYVEGGREVPIPEDFYSTSFYTDKILEYLRESEADTKPFFVYAAYTAPHWPLQAPDDYLDRYRGVYDEGYDVLRERRVENLVEKGIVPAGTPTPERLRWVRAWEALSEEEKQIEARRMEIYAAMVEHLDESIGRLLDYLRESGQYDNTVILFFSDNGPEGNRIGEMYDNETWLPERFDNSYENMGRIGSYVWTDAGWAQAQTAPFRLFKGFATEGGTRVPAIVKHVGESIGASNDSFASVKDVAPTLLDLAGVEHPSTYRGREVAAMQGESWVPLLSGDSETIHAAGYAMGWELFGRRAIEKDGWKIVAVYEPYGSESFCLYDVARDPGESRDLSKEHPDKLQELLSSWDSYVRENGVILPTHDMGYGLVSR